MTKIIAIVAVVVIVAAVGVFMLTSNNNNSGNNDDQPGEATQNASENLKALSKKLDKMYSDVSRYPADLMIMGNADMDDNLDNDDVEYIENLIKNGYNYVDNYMADANYDGLIDEKDVEYVKALINFGKEKVYYLNMDFKVCSYLMKGELHLANILTQVLEIECILADDRIVATDERCAYKSTMGNFYTEYESILDYSKLGNIGSHKSPNQETIAQVAKDYGNGYLTVWMNRASVYNTEYIDNAFANNEKIQIVRLPTWENDGTISGILTAGYLFNYDGTSTWDKAYEYVKWYKSVDAKINAALENVSDSQVKKVLIYSDWTGASLSDYSVLLNAAGERLNLLELKIDDVMGKYIAAKKLDANNYSTNIDKETLAEIYQTYGLDLIIGTNGLPYNCTAAEAIDSFNQRMGQIGNFNGTELLITGWINASGAGDIIFKALIGSYLYEEQFTAAGIDAKEIANEFLKRLGSSLTADDLNMLYAGEGNPHNIMVGN